MLQSAMFKRRRIPIFIICLLSTANAWQMSQNDFEMTKKQCEKQNDGAACSKLYYYYISAKRYYLKTLQEDKQKALYYAKKACALDDEDGCFTAGMTLYYGDNDGNIVADRGEGKKLLRKACDLGKEDVCTFFLNKDF